jgi:hypothetical protein
MADLVVDLIQSSEKSYYAWSSYWILADSYHVCLVCSPEQVMEMIICLWLQHRGERRGVGGIFFDDLNDYDQETLLRFATGVNVS